MSPLRAPHPDRPVPYAPGTRRCIDDFHGGLNQAQFCSCQRQRYSRAANSLGIGWKRLRRSLPEIEPASEISAGSDFGRMIEWTRHRLASLEVTIDPGHIDQDLTKIGLFPGPDDLDDPESDPPEEPYQ